MSMNEQKQAERIRAHYVETQPTEMDELRELDAKVRRPAAVFGYVFGSISAVIMGAGMSLVMTDIGSVIGLADGMIPGIGIGLFGMAMALLTYPIYKGILNSRKKKYAPEILRRSERIMRK